MQEICVCYGVEIHITHSHVGNTPDFCLTIFPGSYHPRTGGKYIGKKLHYIHDAGNIHNFHRICRCPR